MTAAIATRSQGKPSGLRPVEPRRDMRALAEVIETAFSENLDAEGLRMLGWMKLLGRLGWFGWLLSFYVLPPAARPHGFVWEADGRLVGNASVLPVEGHRSRWVLVNVAVYPDYQRQGIARQLVQACITYTRMRKGRWLFLQADGTNPGAHKLYTSLGFEPFAAMTTWVGKFERRKFQSMDKGLARPRLRDEWQEQMSLARKLHPEGLIWPYPLSSSLYRSIGLMDSTALGSGRHWVWREAGELKASLSLRWSADIDAWRMLLVVDPEAREKVESSMLACGLSNLPWRSARVVLEYPAGVAEELLRELGFRERRRLTWMKCNLEN